MSGKKGKTKKSNRRGPSIRQLRSQATTKTIKAASSDPIGSLSDDWFNNAKNAEKWKEKWECMQELMENACGDPWGKAELHDKYDNNKKANEVLALFAKWLWDENHIFTRQHILKLLVPFSKSYEKGAWRKATSIAEGIMLKQWMEKKHGFLPLCTPALLAVHHVSSVSLKKWREPLIECMQSSQGQVRMSVWDFLAKICMTAKKKTASKDIGSVLSGNVIELLIQTIIHDKEKDVRDCCAKFVIGALKVCSKSSALNKACKEIRKDKRAHNTLDAATVLYDVDLAVLNGKKVPNDDEVKMMVEKKHKIEKKKATKSRKNNMRAMIAAAKKQAQQEGGGGQIEIGQTNTKATAQPSSMGVRETKPTSSKKKKSKPKPKPEPETESDSEDDDEKNSSSDSDGDNDSEEERERERERQRQKKEKERKERKRAERERKKKEKAERKERERKERERERQEIERQERERQERQRQEKERKQSEEMRRSDDSSSDKSEDSDSYDDRRSNIHKKQKRSTKRNGPPKSSPPSAVVDNKVLSKLSEKIEGIDNTIHSMKNDIKGMNRTLTEVTRATANPKSVGVSSKSEEKIMKILSQLQKDVKIMKNDIAYIKACWEDAESVPSDN